MSANDAAFPSSVHFKRFQSFQQEMAGDEAGCCSIFLPAAAAAAAAGRK